MSGKATQVRVVQGREPRHFIKMFGGKMVVFSGGKASGFKNVHDHDTYDADGTRMFRFVKYPVVESQTWQPWIHFAQGERHLCRGHEGDPSPGGGRLTQLRGRLHPGDPGEHMDLDGRGDLLWSNRI